jgi:hypothetical protein
VLASEAAATRERWRNGEQQNKCRAETEPGWKMRSHNVGGKLGGTTSLNCGGSAIRVPAQAEAVLCARLVCGIGELHPKFTASNRDRETLS